MDAAGLYQWHFIGIVEGMNGRFRDDARSLFAVKAGIGALADPWSEARDHGHRTRPEQSGNFVIVRRLYVEHLVSKREAQKATAKERVARRQRADCGPRSEGRSVVENYGTAVRTS